MKKVLAIILSCILCIGTLASCGGASAQEMVGTYEIDGTVYYAMLLDSAFNPTDKFEISEEDGKVIVSHKYLGVSGEDVSAEIGELKKFSLKKDNFNKLIYGDAWEAGYSAESIRKNNKAAFKAENKGGEKVYILLQKDGMVLVANIKNKEGVTSCAYVRKLSRITE